MTAAAAPALRYAGFWIRFGAILIDAVILSVVQGVIFMALFGGAFITVFQQVSRGVPEPDPALAGSVLASVGMFQLVSFAAQLAYSIFFWVRFGATPGKMALGLKVVKASGGPLTAGLAIGRYSGVILSSLILGIGFMMAGWDDQKRALHDRLAGTRVIHIN